MDEPQTIPEVETPQEPVRTVWRYAQINIETGFCITVSELSGEVIADNMILLDDDSTVKTRDTWDAENGIWIPYVPPAPEPPGPSTKERIAALEAELSASKTEVLNTMDALFDVYLMVLDLQAGGSVK